MADRQIFERVIQNLISNSIKCSNGEEVRFAISEKGDIIIVVSNPIVEGIDTDKIFQMFYRREQSRRGDGMGLGLYICDKFVHRMGGNILAECQSDRLGIKIILIKTR